MSAIAGVILAGGLSRRMGGGDKFFRKLSGKPVIEWVIERARNQVSPLILNANGDAARFQQFGLPVIPDAVGDYAGPLAGILTGLEWALAECPGCRWVATFPADAPFVPIDMVTRLLTAVESQGARLACTASGGRTHPVCGLWPVDLAVELRRAMEHEELRKIDVWTSRYPLSWVDYEIGSCDPFFNINRPEDLVQAEDYCRLSISPKE